MAAAGGVGRRRLRRARSRTVHGAILCVESGDGTLSWRGAAGNLEADQRYFIASVTCLVLHGGARDGSQVVPATWIDATLRATDAPRTDTGAQPFGADFDLGYHWWLPDASAGDAVAIGLYGQYLYVHPGLGVVIVKTSADATRPRQYLNPTRFHSCRNHTKAAPATTTTL